MYELLSLELGIEEIKDERGVRFDGDQPKILSTEIRTRHLRPEDSE